MKRGKEKERLRQLGGGSLSFYTLHVSRLFVPSLATIGPSLFGYLGLHFNRGRNSPPPVSSQSAAFLLLPQFTINAQAAGHFLLPFFLFPPSPFSSTIRRASPLQTLLIPPRLPVFSYFPFKLAAPENDHTRTRHGQTGQKRAQSQSREQERRISLPPSTSTFLGSQYCASLLSSTGIRLPSCAFFGALDPDSYPQVLYFQTKMWAGPGVTQDTGPPRVFKALYGRFEG